jgi:hypothetical protein
MQLVIIKTIHKNHIYPFLFALFPVLFLYLRNIREVLPARVLPALGVSLACAIVFWLLTRIATSQPGKWVLLHFLPARSRCQIKHCYPLKFQHISLKLTA